ncbi:hypothetical protein MED222_05620 [Vibrio sp. MED222]|nr:hypothetical protein MED222_05620 [Vibrio sp. MED222]
MIDEKGTTRSCNKKGSIIIDLEQL